MRYNSPTMFDLTARKSYAIEGTELLLPKNFPRVDSFDQLFLDAKDLDIKFLRMQITLFQQMPMGNLRLLVINNAHNLSELLQNTLLKVVEEPPTKGVVVLQVRSVESLLPTLRSRLERITGEKNMRVVTKELIISNLFSLDRDIIISELEQVVMGLNLYKTIDIHRHNALEITIRKLRRNVNSKLALDWLGLNWQPESGKE